MARITNPRYKQLLNENVIKFISKKEFERILRAVDYEVDRAEALSFIIFLYYTGRRPIEILQLQSQDIRKARGLYSVNFVTMKHGVKKSVVYVPKNKYTDFVWRYVYKKPPYFILFHDLVSERTRKIKSNIHKQVIMPDGSIKKVPYIKYKEYTVYTDKVYYFIKRWTKKAGAELPPYFFRHNRFSKLVENGASVEEVMMFKGAKSLSSVMMYLHLSNPHLRKLAEKME